MSRTPRLIYAFLVTFLIISSILEVPVSTSNSTIGDSTGSENVLLQGESHSDPSSVAVKWKYNASGSILFSPMVGEDGTIYIISEPFYTLHAINPDGALKWKYEIEYKVRFAPVVSADGTVYLCVEDPKGDDYLYAINDGILKWKIKVEFEFENEIAGRGIAPGKIDCPPIIDEQGTIYFMATGKAVLSPKAIFAINKDGTLRYKIADHKIERWGYEWKYGIDKFGDLIISIDTSKTLRMNIRLIAAKNGMAYVTAVAIKNDTMKQYYDVIAAIGSDGKVKWVSELFNFWQRIWYHVIVGKNAMYLVIFNYTSPSSDYDVYLQALDYDGKVRYEFRSDEYWNKKFYSTYVTVEIMPVIDKDDTVYLIFSNPQYGDFSIIYAIGSNGTLKWKCKLPFAISESLVKFFNCDKAGRLYLLYSILFSPYYTHCLYVINPDGELSWDYKYRTTLETRIRPPLVSEDGTIYLFSRNITDVRRAREKVVTSITFDIVHILSPEGKLIKRLSIFDLIGYPAEVTTELWDPILSPNGTILSLLYMEGKRVEILVAIGPPPLKKTMLTMNINPSKIVEKVRETITITGRLTNETGYGLSERVVNIYRDGNVIGGCTTDSNGYYEYKWKNTYLEKGSYTITAKFGGDPDYAASSVSTSLIVTENQLPIASFVYSPENPKAGEEVKLDASASRDPDGEIKFYEWDLNGDGEYDGYTTSPVIYYFWDKSGTYLVKLKVIDNSGDSSEFVKEVNIKPNSLWEKIKKFFSPSVMRLSESERKRFEIIKSRLGIHNYPHSNNPSSDPDFYWVSDDQLLTILKKKVDPAASDLTYEALITDTLYDMELVDSIAGRSWSVDPKITEYFESMSEVNAWAKVGLMVSKETLSGIIKEMGGSDIGLGPVLMLPDLCKALGGLKLLEEEFYRRALWHYFELRDSGYSPDEAFKSSPIPPKYQNDATKKYFEELWREYSNHISDGGGLEQEFKRQVISQLRKILLSAFEKYKFEPYQIYILKSSCEICVFDSQKRVTGMVDGKYREEIPNSAYDDESKTIVIFNATDSYTLQVKGIKEGNYSLLINSIINRKSTVFTANDILIKPKEIHEYSFDWRTLSQGGKGATVQVDFDGDGKFEKTFTTSTELSRSEFLQSTSEIPPSLNLIAILIAIIVIVAIVFPYLRKRGKL